MSSWLLGAALHFVLDTLAPHSFLPASDMARNGAVVTLFRILDALFIEHLPLPMAVPALSTLPSTVLGGDVGITVPKPTMAFAGVTDKVRHTSRCTRVQYDF